MINKGILKMKTIIGFILLSGIVSLSFGDNDFTETIEATQEGTIDTFTFHSDGIDINGKIYLPASFSIDKNFYAIYLIDFTEQHFPTATDEFETVISATEDIQDLDAVVVTLEEHLDVDANTGDWQEYYNIFNNMTSYVDTNYTNNNSRTFIARGSEAGLVLMTLFLEDSVTSVFDNFVATDSPSSFNSYIINIINEGNFPQNKRNKKLHFSFSTSNNRTICINLINTINEAQYPWLQFESLEYTTSNFENTYLAAFAEGLNYIFNDLPTGSEENLSTVPKEYQLEQNYPNPFNPSTTIKFTISDLRFTTLKVYDLLGREIATLVNEEKPVGSYEVKLDATSLPSGIYFYRLQAGSFVETKKMVLMK